MDRPFRLREERNGQLWTHAFTEEIKARLRARLAEARPGARSKEPQQKKARYPVTSEDILGSGVGESENPSSSARARTPKPQPLTEGTQLAQAALLAERGTREKATAPHAALEDIKDTSTKSLKNPLVLRALASAASSEEEEERKLRSRTTDQSSEVLSECTECQKKGKKKKRKRRITPEGILESFSESSSDQESSEDEEPASGKSDSDCEAPLRKRSAEKPGSVLQMLTDHVKTSLDQTATTNQMEGGQQFGEWHQDHDIFYVTDQAQLHHLPSRIEGDVPSGGRD